MKRIKYIALTSLVSFLYGCAVGPDYQLTNDEDITGWQFDNTQREGEKSIAESEWRSLYQNPELVALIEQGLAHNIDLQIASENMYRAAQDLTISQAQSLPLFDAQWSQKRERNSLQAAGNNDINDQIEFFGALSWELDLWGKLRRANESAFSDLQATEADYYGTQILVIADIASLYYSIQDVTEQIQLTKNNILAREKSKRIAELRHKQGIISGLDVTQSNVELVTERLKLPPLENALRANMNSLSILIGEVPQFRDIAKRTDNVDVFFEKVAVGLPSELLRRRPDVIAEERRLQAVSARIGVARADFFPSISLTGEAGVKSTDLSQLLENADRWLLGLDISMPIFNWGQIDSAVNKAESDYRAQVLTYRKVILTAFKETSEAIDRFQQTRVEYSLKQELLDATQENYRIAKLSYDNGAISYLDVLDAQRNLASAESDFSAAINQHQDAFIRLFKSLGGGWDNTLISVQDQNQGDSQT